jgi:hypothetical protein
VQTAILKNDFYEVGEGALGMILWNHGCGRQKKLGNYWSIWSAIGNVIYIFIHVLSKCTCAWLRACIRACMCVCVCVCVWRKGPVSEWVPTWANPSREGVTDSSQTPLLRLVKVWERTKIWSWFPMECKTKIDCAGKGQQQFYLTAWPHYPKSKKF